MNINWKLFSEALDFYQGCGYKYIEVPWTVTPEILDITKPPKAASYKVDTGHLVGSAEQSFLQLLSEDKLGTGNFCALTPCFRSETTYNEFTRHYFMKLELINIPDPNEYEQVPAFIKLCDDAYLFFTYQLKKHGIKDIDSCKRVYIEHKQWDLNINGHEVGSYGYRQYENLSWHYGTGLAEPRFTSVLASLAQNNKNNEN